MFFTFSPVFLCTTATYHNTMIHTQNMALMLVAIVAVASGGFYSLVEQDTQATPSATSEQGQILGHITLVLTDGDGKVKAYTQTDNAVYDTGFQQLIDDVFGDDGTPACTGCQNVDTTDVDVIGIGTGVVPAALSATDLLTPTPSTCNRVADVTGATSVADSFLVTISASFGGSASTADIASVNCEGLAIIEAGLFNNVAAATGEMFAAQAFSAINIASTTDVLTVTWELTFGP